MTNFCTIQLSLSDRLRTVYCTDFNSEVGRRLLPTESAAVTWPTCTSI